MIYFSDIELYRSVAFQLAAVLLVVNVIVYMNFLKTKRYVQNGHKLLSIIEAGNWDGPTANSVLCSKHFEQDCFIVESVRYREDMGIPAKKRHKPNAIHTGLLMVRVADPHPTQKNSV